MHLFGGCKYMIDVRFTLCLGGVVHVLGEGVGWDCTFGSILYCCLVQSLVSLGMAMMGSLPWTWMASDLFDRIAVVFLRFHSTTTNWCFCLAANL